MICSSMCLTSNSSGAGERSFFGMTSGWLTGSLSSARWLVTITVPWNVFCPVFQEVDVINSEPDVLPFLNEIRKTKSTSPLLPLKKSLVYALFKVKDPPIVAPNVYF